MGLMPQSLAVCCPACRREHVYAAPSYPCVCGAPVTPPLDPRGTPCAVTHRVWAEDWVTVECASCGRRGQWPHPELGCPCGTVVRIPVAGTLSEPGGEVPEVARSRHRPAFQPVTIRTARDAVTAAALYLRWLGYRDIRRADQRPPSGIGLAARGLLAQIDPTVHPAAVRDVECLWLTAMTESSGCAYFSLAGYAPDARTRADTLGVPLFVLDLTGTPQPVNSHADALDSADG
ncbi:hypothetical protein BN159_2108 [Streptomyces davaonensis JCM 4913]|uniref:Restriction endonuclease type IV Mrr domain-containing protein n=1 Tax=Streptomyces davaonensis (strain DSM 101723 / JCM 4913 / KCC S-0913 / 768) TaxID=1214101 RepID=K4R001_STRDJ|nr:hypothetical protein [Streptomyces davaonensis]CCK26487.1 hypothetical protein BN159_2108 [Streptomyces davaonensis JCM 4913]